MATVKMNMDTFGQSRDLGQLERLAYEARDPFHDGIATPTTGAWLTPRDVDPQLHDSSLAAVAFELKGERERRREADLSRADAGDTGANTGAGISPRGRVTCCSDMPCTDMAQDCMRVVRSGR